MEHQQPDHVDMAHMVGKFGETFYDEESEKNALEAILENGLPFFHFYGYVIPIVATVGIVQDIVCFCAFQHRDLRSICTMILNALFMADIFHLICLALIKTPTAWLVHNFSSVDDDGFWPTIDAVQKIYTGVYPFYQLAQCLVFLYTVAVIIEQYCVYFHPRKLYNWSTRDTIIKLIITLMNIAILIHLMHFFKFIRQETLYSAELHHRICLSEIYRSDDYQTLDQYVYFIMFVVAPWFVALFGLIMIVYGKLRSRSEAASSEWPYPDRRLARVFKSGRSTKTVFMVGGLFLVCGGGVCVTQGLTVTERVYTPLSANCLDIPQDAQFIKFDPLIELLFYVFLLTNSSCRLLLCVAANRDFRLVLRDFFVRQKRRIQRMSRKIKIFCACRPTGKDAGETVEMESEIGDNLFESMDDYQRAYVIPAGRRPPVSTYI